MTITRANMSGEELSAALSKSLPVANPMVDHYRGMAVWDQAIIESLATFADTGHALPSDVRELLSEFLNSPDISTTVRRHASHYLAEIPRRSSRTKTQT